MCCSGVMDIMEQAQRGRCCGMQGKAAGAPHNKLQAANACSYSTACSLDVVVIHVVRPLRPGRLERQPSRRATAGLVHLADLHSEQGTHGMGFEQHNAEAGKRKGGERGCRGTQGKKRSSWQWLPLLALKGGTLDCMAL